MYLEDYLAFLVLGLVCMIISIYASSKVNRTYSKYEKVANRKGLSGFDAAEQIKHSNNLYDISINRVKGKLTDHYDPRKEIVRLSDSTFSNNSIAAVAVAAHEMGHVMQKKTGYLFYKIRTLLVPIVNFGSYLAFPLVLIGLLIDIYSTSSDSNTGFYVALVGVILYGGAFMFSLMTLPVELNASRRAADMLISEGILDEKELPAAKKVLSAAALTYVASLLTTLVYFLRFLVRVLTIFGRRRD